MPKRIIRPSGTRRFSCLALALLLSSSLFAGTPLFAYGNEDNARGQLVNHAEGDSEDVTSGEQKTPANPSDEETDPSTEDSVSSDQGSEASSIADSPATINDTGTDAELGESAWSATINPIRNTTEASITLPGIDGILSAGAADTLVVQATMEYNGVITRSVEESFSLDEIRDGAQMDFCDFGKFNVSTKFLLAGSTVFESTESTVGVTADTYNIAPVSATLPLTFFSLDLWGDNSLRNDGPTILLLERPNAYNWNALPAANDNLYGAYGLPYLTKDEISYQPGDFDAAAVLFQQRLNAMKQYVHDLLELDPTSHFNLYCVDLYCGIVQHLIYANKIPESQYTVKLMSDGSFTYNWFTNYMYAGNDPQSQHEKYVNEWTAAKDYAYANGSASSNFGYNAAYYFWACVDTEPNIELWIARKDLLKTDGDENNFGKSAQENPKVVQVNIASLLKTNIQPSENATAEFKKLYNFNDGYFSAAEAADKDVMLFLGTRVTSEQGFSDYARFVMSYYGDNYLYYYKGHPGTPTDLYPIKQQELESLGITDVDSSVAAELILFFNPEIYLSGYSSSTYASVPEGMAKGMFQMTKEQGLANPQYANMEYWMSPVNEGTPEAIRSLCATGHANYLVEFSDVVASENGYDIAIWDATTSEINYLEEDGKGGFSHVGSDSGITGDAAIKDGEYVIQSAIENGKVLDVAAASHLNGANVQLYEFNNTNAQKWRVSVNEAKQATITNMESGLALDAQYGQSVPGTNVQQYESNGSLAQKWHFVANSDGTVRIVSALDNSIVIDVAEGNPASGSNIQLWSDNGTAAQSFTLLNTSPAIRTEGQADIEDGYYRLSTAVNMTSSLDVTGWDSSDGVKIQTWDSTGGENQLFRITKQESGYYHIVNAWTNKALDITDGCVIPGTPVQQWSEASGNMNQEWAIVEHTGGSYTIQSVSTGLMLEVCGGVPYDGQAIQGWTPNGTQAQRWLISKDLAPNESLDTWANNERSTVPDGTYIIESALSNGLVLDVAGASHQNYANVQLYGANFTKAQKWMVSHDAKGYVTFASLESGKVLDVSGASKSWGANVQQYDANGTSAQKWIVSKSANGTYTITSALSPSICLDIQDALSSAGANIQTYKANGTSAQRFIFYKAL